MDRSSSTHDRPGIARAEPAVAAVRVDVVLAGLLLALLLLL